MLIWKCVEIHSLTFLWFFLWNFDFPIIYMNTYPKIHCFVINYHRITWNWSICLKCEWIPGESRLESSKSIETNWFCIFVMASNIRNFKHMLVCEHPYQNVCQEKKNPFILWLYTASWIWRTLHIIQTLFLQCFLLFIFFLTSIASTNDIWQIANTQSFHSFHKEIVEGNQIKGNITSIHLYVSILYIIHIFHIIHKKEWNKWRMATEIRVGNRKHIEQVKEKRKIKNAHRKHKALAKRKKRKYSKHFIRLDSLTSHLYVTRIHKYNVYDDKRMPFIDKYTDHDQHFSFFFVYFECSFVIRFYSFLFFWFYSENILFALLKTQKPKLLLSGVFSIANSYFSSSFFCILWKWSSCWTIFNEYKRKKDKYAWDCYLWKRQYGSKMNNSILGMRLDKRLHFFSSINEQ